MLREGLNAMTYVIVSKCECGFWSNQYGWVHDKNSASTFSNAGEFPLPLRARHEGSFLDINLAPEYYLEEPLVAGDEVVWDDPSEGPTSRTLWVDKVKTTDGYARTSEDVVVLRDSNGMLTETVARSVVHASPLAFVLEA